MVVRYRALRRQPNLVLVAGSGFGGVEDSLPYLTGEWSVRFGRPAMPFDGVLLGSRMMVAREARTAPAVKKLIVATPGVSDELEWETSYDGVAGGVITVCLFVVGGFFLVVLAIAACYDGVAFM
jgi:fatty acid synthase subunit beta